LLFLSCLLFVLLTVYEFCAVSVAFNARCYCCSKCFIVLLFVSLRSSMINGVGVPPRHLAVPAPGYRLWVLIVELRLGEHHLAIR
jgi:hypothetical protein